MSGKPDVHRDYTASRVFTFWEVFQGLASRIAYLGHARHIHCIPEHLLCVFLEPFGFFIIRPCSTNSMYLHWYVFGLYIIQVAQYQKCNALTWIVCPNLGNAKVVQCVCHSQSSTYGASPWNPRIQRWSAHLQFWRSWLSFPAYVKNKKVAI